MITDVMNLMTGEVQTYTCSPEEAVIAAYAQSLGDWNTWDYNEKYKDKVEYAQFSVACGVDNNIFGAFLDGRRME
jgi:hypothetical protein